MGEDSSIVVEHYLRYSDVLIWVQSVEQPSEWDRFGKPELQKRIDTIRRFKNIGPKDPVPVLFVVRPSAYRRCPCPRLCLCLSLSLCRASC